jgi:hypothetical protein
MGSCKQAACGVVSRGRALPPLGSASERVTAARACAFAAASYGWDVTVIKEDVRNNFVSLLALGL